MTGARLTGHALIEARRRCVRYAGVTMCIGGGMGAAAAEGRRTVAVLLGPWKLFGRIAYHQQLWIIAGVWVVNLAVSAIWLRFFIYGPLEWVWRSLVHWRLQPLRQLGASVGAGAVGR